MSPRELPLRPNVCLLVYNSDYKLFLGKRADETGIWQLPQGGVESDATLEENALREAEEELGVDSRKLGRIRRLEWTYEYDFRTIPKYARGKYRGQSQTFWAIEFRGENSDIDVTRYHPEFTDWKWCTPDEVRKRAEPIRLKGYEPALVEFERLAAKEKL